MSRLFTSSHEVTAKEINDDYTNVNQSDLAIICVPTPMKEDGSCDISTVEDVIAESKAPLYLIKSTIPPGTTEYLDRIYKKNIVFSPEYIGEGSYPTPWFTGIPHSTDVSKHNFHIFGGQAHLTSEMVDIFTPVCGPYCKYMQTDSTTAELVKYMENAFFATKVTFCHDFFNIAKAFGSDYNEVRELWLLDKRNDRGSTAVFRNKLGYDGKCLPKDISGIYHAAKRAGHRSKLLEGVMQTNQEQLASNNG